MKSRKRNRKLGYDYSQDNLYFVTICVQDKICCFGSVVSVHNPDSDKKAILKLNDYGLIVDGQMAWLNQQYEYIDIHNYILMPNHVHLILEIDTQKVAGKEIKIKSLSQLIGAFKTTSSKLLHLAGFLDFSWQRSFHDHIIRNDESYYHISNYIDNNPEKWFDDTFYSEG